MAELQKVWMTIDGVQRCLQALTVPRIGEHILIDGRSHLVSDIQWTVHSRPQWLTPATDCLNQDFVLEPMVMTKALSPKAGQPEMRFDQSTN